MQYQPEAKKSVARRRTVVLIVGAVLVCLLLIGAALSFGVTSLLSAREQAGRVSGVRIGYQLALFRSEVWSGKRTSADEKALSEALRSDSHIVEVTLSSGNKVLCLDDGGALDYNDPVFVKRTASGALQAVSAGLRGY